MIVELIAAAALANAANSGQSNWTVSEASPGVSVLHLGATHVLARGAKVIPGDTVITTTNSRAVLVNGQQYAIVAPNSRLEIADPDPQDGLTQVIEHLGNAVFSVRKGAAPHFVVRTPYLAAVVKGTTFSVTVDPTGASVQVVEGAVDVATIDGGAHHLVTPGDIAIVSAKAAGRLSIQGRNPMVVQSTKPSPPPASTTTPPPPPPPPPSPTDWSPAGWNGYRAGLGPALPPRSSRAAWSPSLRTNPRPC